MLINEANVLHVALMFDSVHDSRVIFSQSPTEVVETKPFSSSKDHEQGQSKLTCCEECTSNYEKEAHLLKSGQQKLPAWLQPHGTEASQKVPNICQVTFDLWIINLGK